MTKIEDIKWYQTIRSKLIFVIVITVTSVLGAVGLYAYKHIQSSEQASLQELADVTASRLSVHLRLPMWGVDHEQVDELLIAELEERKVEAIVVIDEDGKTLFSGKRRSSYGDPIDVTGQVFGDFIEVNRPVTYNSADIGMVSVFLTPKYMNQDLQKFGYAVIVTLVVLIIVIIIIMAMTLGRILIKPLLNLTAVAEKISRGNLNQKLDIHSTDELGYLANTFNRMQHSLIIAIRRLSGKTKKKPIK